MESSTEDPNYREKHNTAELLIKGACLVTKVNNIFNIKKQLI
jgi:hypothetical protein